MGRGQIFKQTLVAVSRYVCHIYHIYNICNYEDSDSDSNHSYAYILYCTLQMCCEIVIIVIICDHDCDCSLQMHDLQGSLSRGLLADARIRHLESGVCLCVIADVYV